MRGKRIGNRYLETVIALDFYEAIVDSAFGLINYHLIEISSS